MVQTPSRLRLVFTLFRRGLWFGFLFLAFVVLAGRSVAGVLPRHPELVAWYPMDAASSELVTGWEAAAFHPWLASQMVAGKVGQALRIADGSTAGGFPSQVPGDGTRFTVDLWIRLESTNSLAADAVLSRFLWMGEFGPMFLGIGPGGTLELQALDRQPFLATRRIPDADWHHVALTRDGGRFAFFIDGEPAGASDLGWTFPLDPGSSWRFANPLSRDVFRGDVDELAIHSVPLGADEIRAIFEAGELGRAGGDLAVSSIRGPQFLGPEMDVVLEWVLSNPGDVPVSGKRMEVAHRGYFPGAVIQVGSQQVVVEGMVSEVMLPRIEPGESIECRLQGRTAAFPASQVLESISVFVPYAGWDRHAPNNRVELLPLAPGECAARSGEGLVAWLRFESDLVDSITRKPALATGLVTFGPGMVSTAVQLDGTSGITVGSSPAVSSGQFVWDGWVKPTSGGARYGVIASLEGSPGQSGVTVTIARTSEATDGYWSIPAGRLAVRFGNLVVGQTDSDGWLDGGIDLPEDRWTHVGVAVANGWLQTYLGGLERRETRLSSSPLALVDSPLRIGLGRDGAGERVAGFAGMIDEVGLLADQQAWRGVALAGASRSGRCGADAGVRWKQTLTGPLRPNVPVSLTFEVENSGVELLTEAMATVELPPNWVVEGFRAIGGQVQLQTNSSQLVTVTWRGEGVLVPGEVRAVTLDVIPGGGGFRVLWVRNQPVQAELRVSNDSAFIQLEVLGGQLAVRGLSLTEPVSGSRVVDVPVVLLRALDREVQVDVSTEAGSTAGGMVLARPGIDFMPTSSRLTFPVGVLTQWLQVVILSDNIFEATESLAVRLTNPVGADIEVRQELIRIFNSSPRPAVAIGAATRQRPEGPGERIEFPVRLGLPAEVELRFNYWTTNRTARAGVDFAATNGTLVIPPGTTQGSIGVELLPTGEGDRAAWFQLAGAYQVSIGTPDVSMGIGTLEPRGRGPSAAALALETGGASPEVGADLPIRVQALDWRRQPFRASRTGVRIFALPASGRPHPVVLSSIGTVGQIALQSTVPSAVSLKGWSLALYGELTWPHPTLSWVGGDTNQLQALGSMFLSAEQMTSSGFPLRWDPALSSLGVRRPMAVLLRDPAGNVVDFFCHGEMGPGSILYPVRLDPTEWSGFESGLRPQPRVLGDGTFGSQPGRFVRYGAETAGAATEWMVESPHGSGVLTGMAVPWRAATVSPEILREIALDADGAWAGTVKLPEVPGHWRLGVELPDGVRVFSAPLDLGKGSDLRVHSFEIGSPVVVRQPGKTPFRVVVSNAAAQAATGVVVRLPVPGALAFSNLVVNASQGAARTVPSDARTGARIEANLGTLAAGAVAEVHGTMVGFRVESILGSLLWAAVSADSANSDQSNDFAVCRFDLVGPTSPVNVPFALWRGERDFRDRVGTNHARGIGPVEFVPQGATHAFRLGSKEAGIQLPAGLNLEPASNGSVSLHLVFRLPLIPDDDEPRALVSRVDPQRPAESFQVEQVNGLLRVQVGGQWIAARTLPASRPYDVRDGQWHWLSLTLRRTTPSPELSVGLDERLFFVTAVPATFSIAGASEPLVIGGLPGRRGFAGEVDEISLIRDWRTILAYDQLALVGRLPETLVSALPDGQLPFLPPEAATVGRPFRLRVLAECAGPGIASNQVLTVRYPDAWAIGEGHGGILSSPGDLQVPLPSLTPGQGAVREFSFVGPVGSNSVEVAFAPVLGVGVFRRGTIPVEIVADGDGDLLPDTWEANVGLSATDPRDARLDADGDGIDALGEFEAGTSPTNPDSVLRLRWAPGEAGVLSLKADSTPGRLYVLERLSGSFTAPRWEAVRSALGTGQELDFGHLFPDEASDASVRVRVLRDR